MTLITPKGNPHAPVWVVVEDPYKDDAKVGYVFSAGLGYVFDKMMQEAGLNDYYVCARRPDPDHLDSYSIVDGNANNYKPPIIIPLGDSLGFFCKETNKRLKRSKGQVTPQEEEADLEKYAGSILISPKLNYPHYIIPTIPPDVVVRDWSIRDIAVNLDLGKAKSELEYYNNHGGTLEPLPERRLIYDFDKPGKFPELIDRLTTWSRSRVLLSTDIESIYPKEKSKLRGHPGIPTVIGLADSHTEGISFEFFREDKNETVILWRVLNEVLKNCPLLGQNFFAFDATRFQMLGFEVSFDNITDTMSRHHILWPELPHKLQFLTKQYTRQPYYKDEGAGWSPKNLTSLKRYNCLDVVVTYEVYEEEEREFDERLYLR